MTYPRGYADKTKATKGKGQMVDTRDVDSVDAQRATGVATPGSGGPDLGVGSGAARCVLLAGRGLGTKAIACAVGRAPAWVPKWRDRFARDRLNGLVDAGRPGRPARFSP